jgi:hypothetical protein
MQGLRVHLHSYDHDPAAADHTHSQLVHVSLFDNSDDYPDQVAEVDLTKGALLKNLKNFMSGLLVAALVLVADILLPRRREIRIPRRHEYLIDLPPWHDSPPPPLRAPPL